MEKGECEAHTHQEEAHTNEEEVTFGFPIINHLVMVYMKKITPLTMSHFHGRVSDGCESF